MGQVKKVAINACYGGFSLSRKAVRRLAELQGRPCYFFKNDFLKDNYTPIADDEEIPLGFFSAFDIPNPGEILVPQAVWNEMSLPDRLAANALYEKHDLDKGRSIRRDDPFLIQVIEELGAEAGTKMSKPVIVEIPDDVDWEIEEHDGSEWVSEVHRTWGME